MLIAEIGLNHFGDFDKATELIRVAHQSGATIIKSQAIKCTAITSGSMNEHFYKKCQFTEAQYIDLIYYARDIGTDLFYSVFGNGFAPLYLEQKLYKIAASQSKQGNDFPDEPNVLFSINARAYLPRKQQAKPMFAGGYLEKVDLKWIRSFSKYYNRPVGYSDHTIGIEKCKRAHEIYKAPWIEKHFTLEKEIKYGNKVFRDTVHGATPEEFSKLAKALGE